jgi:hypothetical protein
MLARVESSDGPAGLTLRVSFCDVNLGKDGLIQLDFPDSAVRAFQPTEVTIGFAGAAVSAPTIIQSVGWTPADPAADTIPADADDARVADSDNDGEPGITVGMRAAIINMDLYTALRAALTIAEISELSETAISGLANVRLEQSILDVGGGGLAAGLVERGPVPTVANPDPNQHTVKMRRAGEAPTCADIVSQAATLFPAPTPPAGG